MRRTSCPRSGARSVVRSRSRSRSSFDLHGEWCGVDAARDLELKEEPVCARAWKLGAKSDLSGDVCRYWMYVRVGQVAAVQGDQVSAHSNVALERRHRSSLACHGEREVGV